MEFYEYYYPRPEPYYQPDLAAGLEHLLRGMGPIAAVLAAVAVTVLLLAAAVSLAAWALQGFGLYTMAKNRGIPNPWLAWVPIGSSWLVGALADRIAACRGKKTCWALLLLGLTAGTSAGGLLVLLNPFLALLIPAAGLVLTVVWYIALYEIYRDCAPDRAVLFLVLSVLLSVQWLLLFLVRDGRSAPTAEQPPCPPAAKPPAPGWQPAEPPRPAPAADPAPSGGWSPQQPGSPPASPCPPEHWAGMVQLTPPQPQQEENLPEEPRE